MKLLGSQCRLVSFECHAWTLTLACPLQGTLHDYFGDDDDNYQMGNDEPGPKEKGMCFPLSKRVPIPFETPHSNCVVMQYGPNHLP